MKKIFSLILITFALFFIGCKTKDKSFVGTFDKVTSHIEVVRNKIFDKLLSKSYIVGEKTCSGIEKTLYKEGNGVKYKENDKIIYSYSLFKEDNNIVRVYETKYLISIEDKTNVVITVEQDGSITMESRRLFVSDLKNIVVFDNFEEFEKKIDANFKFN